MNFTTGLNPQQEQAVLTGLGPVLVLAGPGSGKTRVLTNRIAYLIGAMGVRPYNIIAVTFTNKAAREMETRVETLLGNRPRGLTLGTFHASCARLLRREVENLPFNSNFVIFDADDQVNIVKIALRDFDLDEKVYRPHTLHNVISNAKNELLSPDDFPIQTYRDEVYARVYKRYQELLLNSNALDFDDLLLWMAKLLEENPAVREKYARRFEHVLVDEFQDTNLAQYTLLKHLASFHRNIFVVGDTDQAIYRWRGADYRNVLRFERDFPDAQVILLEQSYRSTQSILNAAMAVIDQNPHRMRKNLFTNRGEGVPITLHEAYDDRGEANFIVDTIASQVARAQNQPGDYAIMYRTNAQSRILEEAFLRAGLPYKLVGAQRFYGRREVKDIIAYLRLVHNPDDEISLTRVINTPSRGIGTKTYAALRTQAQNASVSPGRFLIELTLGDESRLASFSTRASSVLLRFGKILARWRDLAVELNPLELTDAILAEIDYQTYIDDGSEEGHDRWENVLELRRLAAENSQQGLGAFLEQIALVSDQDTLETSTNVPTMLTLHAAKGLEFPVVFIVGLNDGTLPHSRSFDEDESMQEERRLLYVGITRAKDKLYLTYAQNRMLYGYSEQAIPSRFLDDLPEHLLDGDARFGYSRSIHATGISDRWGGAVQEVDTDAVEQRFHPGMRVNHPVWSEGMVLNSRIQDDDEIVDIFFEEVGLKRVAASLARLEIRS